MLEINRSQILRAITSNTRVSGYSHNFYRYPARFSPQAAREIIAEFSAPGDWILDPFMGGATAIVEALTLGRLSIGVDINPLAHFIASVKTTPLSTKDKQTIREWVDDTLRHPRKISQSGLVQNLPERIEKNFASILLNVDSLPYQRQRRFMRGAILRTGQWAVDCRDGLPGRYQIFERLRNTTEEMFEGLGELENACRRQGIPKNKITSRRRLYCRDTVALKVRSLGDFQQKPRLVLTSPPYPGVHILYHRWQIRGRRETPAPYWIAALKDGNSEAFYTFGGRSKAGLEKYFLTLRTAFQSIKQMIDPKAFVVQLVAFADTESQLPQYLQAMHEAGYKEKHIFSSGRISREVPNRKWYSRMLDQHDAAKEILLVHQPDSSRS
ncbi:site-specific DNA-methyltransferase [bacterium]|nr:site-specific DNA-methyltransferase [bacterium]